MGRLPRASLTAGTMGKIWVRRAADSDIHPSSSINPFFWVDGGPDALIAHRKKIADQGVTVSPIIDEHFAAQFRRDDAGRILDLFFYAVRLSADRA